MRSVLSVLLIFLLSFTCLVNESQAKRFGGGKSFGSQRTISNNYSRSSAFQAMPKPSAPSSFSRWLGPLAGLATGGLLAYLMMGHGLGSGLLSWLLIAGVVVFLVNFLRNKMHPATAAATGASSPYSGSVSGGVLKPDLREAMSRLMPNSHSSSMSSSPMSSSPISSSHLSSSPLSSSQIDYPVGFNADEFLREAKVQFIRLQAAYDQRNLNDLREFTTPEVFAEIQLQLQERGHAENVTEVINVDAKLLDVSNDASDSIASVRFSGLIREEANQAPNAVNEIWHFKKDSRYAKWLISGVQQES